MKYVKTPQMSITEFLAGFDTAYNTAIKQGLDKLPQPYLMYMVIENAGLSEQEIKFIFRINSRQLSAKSICQIKIFERFISETRFRV